MDFKKILEQFDAAEKTTTKRTLTEAAFEKSGVKADAKKHKADITSRKQYFVKLANAKGGNKGVTVMADEGESESEVRSRVARDHKSQGWTVSSIREKGDAAEKAAAGEKKSAVTASGKKRGRPPGSAKKVTEGRQTVSEYIAEARMMEKHMTDVQKGERERIVKGMKKAEGDFENRYPGRGKAVMYATATKRAMKEDSGESDRGYYKLLAAKAKRDPSSLTAREKEKLAAYLRIKQMMGEPALAEDDSMMGMTLDQAKQHPSYKTDTAFKADVDAAEKFSSSLSADKKPKVMTTDQAKKDPAYAKDPAFKSRVDKTKPTTGMVVSSTGQQGVAESYQLSKPGTSAEEAVKTLEWDLEEEKEFLSRKQQREVLKIISMLKAGDVDGARDYKVNVCSQDMSEWIDEALDQRWNPFADDDYSLYADRLGEGADKESQMWGGFIGKFFDAIYGYGDDGFEHLDGAAPLWAKLWAKHNGDIDAIIANEPAAVLNKAAKELKSVLDDLQSGLMEGSDKQSQRLGALIGKFFGEIYGYGDDGFEHLDGAAPLWATLWTKHNYDIDAIIANEPAVVLKKVAQELEEVVDDLQSGLMEGTKCNHTAEGKKCPVHGLDECSTYMEESSTINGRVQDPKEMVWKLSDMDYDEAVKKYGKENVKKGPKTRRGDPTVEIKRPLKGSVTEESQFDEDLAQMKKIAGVGAVAAAGLGAHISGENAEIRTKEVERLEKKVASEPDSVKRGQLEKMINDIKAGKPLSKGDIISEVSPYHYDNDVDYYDAVEAEQARLRGDYDDAEEAHIADQADQRRYDHQAAWDNMYEDVEDDAEYTDEVGMVENNLETIERAAEELDSILQDGEDLPEWIEEKVSNAKAMLVSAKEYMASQHANGEVRRVDDDELAEGLGSMIKRGVKKIQGTNRVEKAYTAHLNKAAAGGGDKEIGRAMKALYVGGADTAEKAYDQYHTKKYGHAPSRQQWTGDDEMDESNEFTGALAKAKASGAKEFSVGGKTYPVKESRSAVDELAECYDMAYQQAQAEPEQQGRMTVSANTSTEGTRSLSVNAEGDMADELAQLLSLSGLAGGHRHQEEMEESAQDEFHASTRPAPTTFSVSSQLNTGGDLNRPKVQHPAAAARGDNPLTR
jgi:hypothetical protein